MLGLLPRPFIDFLELVPMQLGLIESRTIGGSWWRVVPVMERQAAYAPVVFLLVVALAIALCVLVVRRFYHVRARRAAPWDCGFARLDARMQDTAEGFGQPIRHIFQPFFAIRRELPIAVRRGAALSRDGRRSNLDARIFADRAISCSARREPVAWLQQGRIATYLLYSFVTLLRDAGARAVSALISWLTQLLEVLAAIAVAPLFSGWIAQCRAWLQNKSAPSIWLPYRAIHKLFHKEAVLAESASPLFRFAPYVVFGSMVLRCRDHSVDGHAAAVLERGRRDRAGRAARDGARVRRRSPRWTSARRSARSARAAR